MMNEIVTIEVLDEAIKKVDEGRPRYEIKDLLVSHRDKLQKEINEFDKWAETQSDMDTSIQLEVDNQLGK